MTINMKIEYGKISPIFRCSMSKLDYEAISWKVREKTLTRFL